VARRADYAGGTQAKAIKAGKKTVEGEGLSIKCSTCGWAVPGKTIMSLDGGSYKVFHPQDAGCTKAKDGQRGWYVNSPNKFWTVAQLV
jgi:hypothetical protein